MPIILAIDTTTQACSCALNKNGQIFELFEIIPRQHAARLLPMVEQLMSEHDLAFSELDAVAYGQGPGSFTGLRIAAGVTQGIAFGANLKVVPVSSLASLAHQVSGNTDKKVIFSALDARIDEVYWGFYEVNAGQVELIGEEGLCKPELLPYKLPEHTSDIMGVGSGMDFLERMPAVYRESISKSKEELYPRAEAVAALAEIYLEKGLCQSPEAVNPVYLRDKVTHS